MDDLINCMKNKCIYMKRNLFLLLRLAFCSALLSCVMNLCSCSDDDSDYYNTSTIRLKAIMVKDRIFPFYCDSAVVTISSSGMTTFHKNIIFSGDSVDEYISGVPIGDNREVTVTVFDPTRTRWYTGKDTIYVGSSRTELAYIKLKQVQPNIISNGMIPGHMLTADEVWRGECLLRGDIIIPQDLQLTIEPGATIRITCDQPDWDSSIFAENEVEIYCNGTLLANGNAQNIISMVPDCLLSDESMWWGIGCSGEYASFTYCHISHAERGMFIFSSMANCNNCLMSYCNAGITDFGPENSFSNITFYDVRFPLAIYNENKIVDISLCDFSKTSLVDVNGLNTNQNITIRNSNFYSKEYHNLEIADGSVMTAVNCYNIDKVDENESGVISLINQSTVPLSDAGCGFTVPFSDSSQSLLKKVIENPETQIKIKEKTDREMVLKLRKIQLQ